MAEYYPGLKELYPSEDISKVLTQLNEQELITALQNLNNALNVLNNCLERCKDSLK